MISLYCRPAHRASSSVFLCMPAVHSIYFIVQFMFIFFSTFFSLLAFFLQQSAGLEISFYRPRPASHCHLVTYKVPRGGVLSSEAWPRPLFSEISQNSSDKKFNHVSLQHVQAPISTEGRQLLRVICRERETDKSGSQLSLHTLLKNMYICTKECQTMGF